MEILGIGPLELFFIIVIALIVLGPKDMVKAGKTIGRFLRKIVTSSSWRSIQQASRELKHLPNKLMNEAGLDEIEKQLGIEEINKEISVIKHDISDWTTPPVITHQTSSLMRETKDEINKEINSPDNNPSNQNISS